MKKAFTRSLYVILSGLLFSTSLPLSARADTFNGNNLIDDSVFNNTSSMTSAQIDSWLNNNFPSSCISTNHGFSSVDPIGYNPSQGFIYGGPVSAGKVVYDAAQAYGINPQVLLTTLQKEQSLVTGGGGCSTYAYASAVGYGCPDGGSTYSYSSMNPALYYSNGVPVTSISNTCVNSVTKVGFTQQLIWGAWLLERGLQRSEGNVNWAVIKPNWDNSDDPGQCYSGPMTQGNFKRCVTDTKTVYYDGLITIDGQSTHMDSGATAALYWYTPHFHGNQNFDSLFSSWFGSLYGNTLTSSLYRMWNNNNRTHYYTSRQNERFDVKILGYKDDNGFSSSATQEAGMIPIYRLYNAGISDFWLLPDGMSRYWGIVHGGYADQGIAFYAYPANPSGFAQACAQGAPVYAMWQNGYSEHFYSTSSTDRYWSLIYGGYVDDKSSSYLDNNNGSVPFCSPGG